MARKIIKIDENKCNGCGACVSACHEGVIGLDGGKAKLLREDHCDGLGKCLPVCPTSAISFVEKEAAGCKQETMACGCPSTHAQPINREPKSETTPAHSVETHLNQWPVQIKLVPPTAHYFNNAHLLIAADCTAYAYGNFHNDYMKDKVTIIGCPKLDECDYSEKLTEILKANSVKSITVARMEMPCCGIDNPVKKAIQDCGKDISFQIVRISKDGRIAEQ